MKTKITLTLLLRTLFQSGVKNRVNEEYTSKRIKSNFAVTLLVFMALIFPSMKASAFVTTVCDNIGTLQKPVWSCLILVNVPCSEVSYVPGMTCSEQYFSYKPKIKMLPEGPAVLDNNGQIIPIASDNIINLFHQKQSLSPEEMKEKFRYLVKNDGGKVSKETIDTLVKELGAEVVIVDKLPAENYCTTCPDINTKGNPALPKFLINIGAGYTQPLATTKANYLTNGFNIQADAFVPFYKKTLSGNNYFLLGLNAGAHYAGIKNSEPNNEEVSNTYKMYAATSSVASASTGSSSSTFSGLLGVQAIFGMNKFYISPIVSTGYSGFTLQGFTQTATYTANGQSRQKDLVQREKQNFNGMIFKPQIRMGYHLSPSISLFTNVAYVFGPNINSTTNIWIPQGGFNNNHLYEPQQLQNGSWQATNTSSKYKALDINLGITVHINAGRLKGKVTKPGDNGTINRRLKEKRSHTPGRLSMTPTTTKQTQGNNFGEKVAGGLQSGANTVGQGASLLGGAVGNIKTGESAIVAPTTEKSISEKGLKRTESPSAEKSIGNTTNTGSGATSTAYAAGKMVAPTTDKSISEKGVKRTESAIVAPTTDKSISEKGLKRTESPSTEKSIGNTTNTGSGATSAAYAAGKMVAPTTDKSISEKGVKRTESAMAMPGNPIGGVIVKGGKNPANNDLNKTQQQQGKYTDEHNVTDLSKLAMMPVKKHSISSAILGNDVAVLSDYEIDDDPSVIKNVIFFKPESVVIETNNTNINNDSYISSETNVLIVKKDLSGKNYAFVIPSIENSSSTSEKPTNRIKVEVLPLDKSKLNTVSSAPQIIHKIEKLNDGNTIASYTYETKLGGEDALITLKYDPKKLTEEPLQNKPIGRFCVCCTSCGILLVYVRSGDCELACKFLSRACDILKPHGSASLIIDNTINTVTNENGEVTFTISEAGEYTLQITNPEISERSISEKGVDTSKPKKSNKRRRVEVLKSNKTTPTAMAMPGNPIGGVIVKGGKNPGGGNAINAVTNENGEVTFTISEAGEYTLQVIKSTIKGVAPAATELLK